MTVHKVLVLALATLVSAPSYGSTWFSQLCSTFVTAEPSEMQKQVEAKLKEQDERKPRYATVSMDPKFINETKPQYGRNQIYYLTAEEREAFRVIEIGEFVYTRDGELVCGGRECEGIFFTDARGRTYFVETIKENHHIAVLFKARSGSISYQKPLIGGQGLVLRHSSLANGEGGIAGTMRFHSGGKLRRLRNDSGHYKSTPEEFAQILGEFDLPDELSFFIAGYERVLLLFLDYKFNKRNHSTGHDFILEIEKNWARSFPNRSGVLEYQRQMIMSGKRIHEIMESYKPARSLRWKNRLQNVITKLDDEHAHIMDQELFWAMRKNPEETAASVLTEKESIFNSLDPDTVLERALQRVDKVLGVTSESVEKPTRYAFELLDQPVKEYFREKGIFKVAIDQTEKQLQTRPDDLELLRLHDLLIQVDSENLGEQRGNGVNRLLNPPR